MSVLRDKAYLAVQCVLGRQTVKALELAGNHLPELVKLAALHCFTNKLDAPYLRDFLVELNTKGSVD